MLLKLFERKRRCIGAFLRPGEGVSAFSGFGSTFVVGTDFGRVLVFNTKEGLSWENEAALEGLGYDETSQDPITQICCASALDLILLVVGEELVGLELKDELGVQTLCSSVSRCAINSHPSSLDDPFAVELAVAHSQKAFVHIGTVVSAEFVGSRKVPTVGRVLKMAFSGQCLCYSTDTGAFYVQNVQQAKGGGALKLFDGATEGHAICTFGMEEFALSGVHELVVFVNAHGVSSRPPISVMGQIPIVGIALKEPFLYILNKEGTVSIFSTIDDQLVQSLAFPTDNVNRPKQKARGHSAPVTCQLENIDGTILIASPGDSSLFELVSVSVTVQVEEQIQLGNLEAALSMLNKCAAFSATDMELLEMQQLREKLAFLLLQNANFSDAIALLLSLPTVDSAFAFLSLIVGQRPELGMGPSIMNCQPKLPIVATFPEIPLHFVKQYLETIVHRRDVSPYESDDGQLTVRSPPLFVNCLARIYTLLEDFDALFRQSDAEWNSAEFRRWLSIERRRPQWAAKLAVKKHCWAEAFATWRQHIGTVNEEEEEEKEEMMEECYATLFKVNTYTEMDAALQWLVPMNAKICMEAIVALENGNPNEKCPPEEIVRLFQHSDPVLLLRYLDGRIYELESPSLHDKLLELYVHFIRNNSPQREESDGTAQLANEYRQKLRHFLLFSNHLSATKAAEVFGNEKVGQFGTEAILARANEHNSVDCLQQLVSSAVEIGVDQQHKRDLLSVGRLLCTRFPSPKILSAMLTLHLRLSASDPSLRANTAHILALLDSATDAVSVLHNVPDDLQLSAFVRSFLGRHVAQRTSTAQWNKMRQELAAGEQSRAMCELGTRSFRTKFHVDEQTKCIVCERRLNADDEFVRQPHTEQLTHLRCFDEQQSVTNV